MRNSFIVFAAAFSTFGIGCQQKTDYATFTIGTISPYKHQVVKVPSGDPLLKGRFIVKIPPGNSIDYVFSDQDPMVGGAHNEPIEDGRQQSVEVKFSYALVGEYRVALFIIKMDDIFKECVLESTKRGVQIRLEGKTFLPLQ